MTTLKGTLVGTLGICIVCGGAFGALADATATTEIPTEAGIALQESLSGHWRAAETKVQEEQRHDAIDHVTEDMGRFKRGKARGRLKEQTSPPAELVIRMTDSTVTLNAGDQHIEFELGGDPIEIEGRNGSSSTTAKVDGDRLVVRYSGDKGERTVAYQADGEDLLVEVTMTGDKLDGPLTYITTYVQMELNQ